MTGASPRARAREPFFRRRWVRVLGLLVVLLAAWRGLRPLLKAKPPKPDARTFEQAARVRIVRDQFGVPHVFGKSDADTAFGLAYAHAEDDWPLLQGVLAASTGRLSLLMLSKTALGNDYYVGLVRVREQVEQGWPELSPAFRELLEGYARGLNLYAYRHPEQADARLLPFTGKDIAAGFAHKVPLMFDLPKVIQALLDGPARPVGSRVLAAGEQRQRDALPGSNAHAVAARRSPDGVTRLNINSHQPWEGPVAWYEAQLVSEEGWNMTGGLFPGSPMILHGHNQELGWAHTVNTPDLYDVFALTPAPGREHAYLLDGAVKDLEVKQAPITIDTGWFDVTVHKAAYFSEHGPVLETQHGSYAIRWAGYGRALKAGEQWYRMNKAHSFAEWKDAMRMQGIPMFNTAYADRANIFYVYNALLPVRSGAYDYQAMLPGDRADAIFRDYLPFDALPQVENPASGFVQTCNSTPFQTTTGPGNPKLESFARNTGIETQLTNRATRSLALLADGPVDRARFLAMKWDRAYAPDAPMLRELAHPLALPQAGDDPSLREARDLLRAWDGVMDEQSPGAALALLIARRAWPQRFGERGPDTDLQQVLRTELEWLRRTFGKINVPLGEVQRLRRGSTDLPLGGGPDVLNATHAREQDGRLVGHQGDSYVLEVELAAGATTSSSVSVYGASNRPGSPHYADQAPLFVRHQLKSTLRDPAELAAHTERSYHPGDAAH